MTSVVTVLASPSQVGAGMILESVAVIPSEVLVGQLSLIINVVLSVLVLSVYVDEEDTSYGGGETSYGIDEMTEVAVVVVVGIAG